MPRDLVHAGNPVLGVPASIATEELFNGLIMHRHDGKDANGHGVLDYYVAGGTANALTVSCKPALTEHYPGMPIYVKAIGDNLGPDVTVKVDGLDTVALKAPARRDLATGNIRKDQIFGMAWDGAGYQVITALSEPAGSIFMHPTATPPPGALVRDGSLLSRTTYAALFYELVTRSSFTAQAFTCTIANPAVFTKSNHGFAGGERLRLSTTGALPTGLNTTPDYFVEIVDTNTFYLHASEDLSDARIVTSGTQSGTHSYTQSLYGLGDGSTTFKLPDDRGLFERGWDHGRGIDSGRALGTAQADSIRAHAHAAKSQATTASSGGANLLMDGVNSNVTRFTEVFGGAETRPMNRAYLPCITY